MMPRGRTVVVERFAIDDTPFDAPIGGLGPPEPPPGWAQGGPGRSRSAYVALDPIGVLAVAYEVHRRTGVYAKVVQIRLLTGPAPEPLVHALLAAVESEYPGQVVKIELPPEETGPWETTGAPGRGQSTGEPTRPPAGTETVAGPGGREARPGRGERAAGHDRDDRDPGHGRDARDPGQGRGGAVSALARMGPGADRRSRGTERAGTPPTDASRATASHERVSPPRGFQSGVLLQDPTWSAWPGGRVEGRADGATNPWPPPVVDAAGVASADLLTKVAVERGYAPVPFPLPGGEASIGSGQPPEPLRGWARWRGQAPQTVPYRHRDARSSGGAAALTMALAGLGAVDVPAAGHEDRGVRRVFDHPLDLAMAAHRRGAQATVWYDASDPPEGAAPPPASPWGVRRPALRPSQVLSSDHLSPGRLSAGHLSGGRTAHAAEDWIGPRAGSGRSPADPVVGRATGGPAVGTGAGGAPPDDTTADLGAVAENPVPSEDAGGVAAGRNTRTGPAGGSARDTIAGGKTWDPLGGENVWGPAEGGNVRDPAEGGNVRDPAEGADVWGPAEGGSTWDPAEGENTWGPAGAGDSSDPLEDDVTLVLRPFAVEDVESALARGALALILVDRPSPDGGTAPRWIVAHSRTGSDFVVHDPWIDHGLGESWLDGADLVLGPQTLQAAGWRGLRAMVVLEPMV